jgi:transposase InsO family protein
MHGPKSSQISEPRLFPMLLASQKCFVIRLDNGSKFKSGEFEAVTSEFGIKHIFSDTYNPQQNAMIEGFNKTLKMMVYRYMTKQNLTKISDQDLINNYQLQ